MKLPLLSGAAFAALLAVLPAHAATMMVGDTQAASCAKAAMAERPDANRSIVARQAALTDCNAALAQKLPAADRTATLVNRGIVLAALGRTDGAVADYDAALSRDPQAADAYVNRGSVLLHEGKFDAARADFDHAIALRPGNAVAYFNRGMANEKLGAIPAAYHDYKQAQALSPDFKPASVELARFQVERQYAAR